jgi:hypothetical protein
VKTEPAIVVIVIGDKEHLDNHTLYEMAPGPAHLHTRYPDATILLTLDGYDDDPRSLWDIPEAADYIRRFARAAKLTNWRSPLFRALEEASRGLLIACDAIDKPHPFRLDIVPDPV